MNTKAIYQPVGAALEYARYACNFYIGCSNSCTYCFNKRWGWGNVPTLKKCFRDEAHALEVFEKELKANLPELQKHGLFFSFTTDPLISKTFLLTANAVSICKTRHVPVKILTKKVDFLEQLISIPNFSTHGQNADRNKRCAIGFTLTGHDELEPNASPNAERIQAMRRLRESGFIVWASIEPIIDFESSERMIDDAETAGCKLFKIGLQSGKKYDRNEVRAFVRFISKVCAAKIYFKDGLLSAAGINRADLPGNCVGRDYNIFDAKK